MLGVPQGLLGAVPQGEAAAPDESAVLGAGAALGALQASELPPHAGAAGATGAAGGVAGVGLPQASAGDTAGVGSGAPTLLGLAAGIEVGPGLGAPHGLSDSEAGIAVDVQAKPESVSSDSCATASYSLPLARAFSMSGTCPAVELSELRMGSSGGASSVTMLVTISAATSCSSSNSGAATGCIVSNEEPAGSSAGTDASACTGGSTTGGATGSGAGAWAEARLVLVRLGAGAGGSGAGAAGIFVGCLMSFCRRRGSSGTGGDRRNGKWRSASKNGES